MNPSACPLYFRLLVHVIASDRVLKACAEEAQQGSQKEADVHGSWCSVRKLCNRGQLFCLVVPPFCARLRAVLSSADPSHSPRYFHPTRKPFLRLTLVKFLIHD